MNPLPPFEFFGPGGVHLVFPRHINRFFKNNGQWLAQMQNWQEEVVGEQSVYYAILKLGFCQLEDFWINPGNVWTLKRHKTHLVLGGISKRTRRS